MARVRHCAALTYGIQVMRMAAMLSCHGNSANFRLALQLSRICRAQGETLMEQHTLKGAASNENSGSSTSK